MQPDGRRHRQPDLQAESHSGYRSVYLEASANWARSFGKHDLSALFLYQQSQRNDVGIDKSEPELALPYRHQGIAGRITYSYDNRYFIEGNFGYNGSENFSPGKRFGFFPSVAAGYVISNEKFFEPVRGVIDLLKIKASYGIVGNDKIGTGDNVRRFIYNGTVDSAAADTISEHDAQPVHLDPPRRTARTPTWAGKRRTEAQSWAPTSRSSAS